MFEKLEERRQLTGPHVRDLYRFYKWHVNKGAFIDQPSTVYKIVCTLCCQPGYKRVDSPEKSKESIICPVLRRVKEAAWSW